MMQDGTPFTAADVKTAVDRIVAGADFTHLATFKSYVTGATVVDDTHVQVMTNKPYATLVTDMPAPIPTAYYNQVGDAEFRKTPMAAGAWKFVSQSLNADVRYERFDDFWDDTRKPNFKNLVFQIVPDESSRVAGVQTGALDIAFGMTSAGVSQFEGNDQFKIVETKESGLAYLMAIDNVFPDEDSPLKDLDVRKALTMAIDREGIAASLYGGYAEVAKSPIPSVMIGFDDSAEPLPYDPDGARELLEAAAPRPQRDAELVQRDVDDPGRRQAGRDRRLAVGPDRRHGDAEPRRLRHDPARLAGQAAARHGHHRRPGVLLLRAGAADAVILLDDRRVHHGQRPGARRPGRADQPGSRPGRPRGARAPAQRPAHGAAVGQRPGHDLVARDHRQNVASWTTIKGCPYASVAWLRAV